MAHSPARTWRIVICAVPFVISGCSGSSVAAARTTPSAGAATASASTAAQAGGPAIDYCKVFTQEQIGAVLGKPVKPGRVPEMATDACRWEAVDGKGVVEISATLAGIWYDMSGHQGQRAVQGIGQKAYVGVSAAGGLQAGAVAACGQRCPALTVDNAFYNVRVDPAPSDNVVLGLLRDVIGRNAR